MNRRGGTGQLETAGGFDFAQYVHEARCPLRKYRNYLDPLDILQVSSVDFILKFGQRKPLGHDRPDGRQRNRALGSDADKLALAADAGPAVDRGPQVLQFGVDLKRRDSDRWNFVIFFIEFVK